MRVKILKDVEYEPLRSDARSCWGSLMKKPSRVLYKTIEQPDGTQVETFKVGPMVFYFPKGRTPELRDEIAAAFIARGVAETFGGDASIEVSMATILDGMAVAP